MIAYIVKKVSDKSFKLKIDYHPLIVRLMEPCTVISQLTNNIKRYPIDCLDYLIDGLLSLQVSCKIVSKFIGGENEILTCLWAYNGSEDDSEDDDRYEVQIPYRPHINDMFKSIDGARYNGDTQRWSFPTESHIHLKVK